MRNNRIVLFLIIFSLLLLPYYVGSIQAQTTPVPVPTILNGYKTLPGLGCGNAYDTSSNKCCSTVLLQKKLEVGGTGTVLDSILEAVNTVAEVLLKPLIEGVANIFGGSMEPCSSGIPSTPGNLKDPGCICLDASSFHSSLSALCKNITASGEVLKCNACMDKGGVWSSIGCVQADARSFIQETLLGTAIGIAGGVALLCIMLAAFQMQTSAGNAEKVKKAQELLTNCITGLMVVIFSVLILKIIGVDILRIPGFS